MIFQSEADVLLTCVRMYVCIFMYVYMYVLCTYVCIHVCIMYVCICMYVYIYVCMYYVQGGSDMTGTDLCVNKPHCAAAVRP